MERSRTNGGRRTDSSRTAPVDTDVRVLADELGLVIRYGLRPSALLDLATDMPGLLWLTCVVPPAGTADGPYERLIRLRLALRAVIGRMESEHRPDFRLGLDRLFGATDDLATVPASERRELASVPLLGYRLGAASFARRHDDEFRGLVADRLVEYDREYALREGRRRMQLGEPADRSVAIDWLDRFQYYYRVWSDVSGILNNIEALLTIRAIDRGDTSLPAYHEASLWSLSCLSLDIDRFVVERGGLWLLSDPDAEQQVSDALYLIQWHPFISQLDSAWLARHVVSRGRRDMLRFHEALERDRRGRNILARWAEWVAACGCGRRPEPGCEVHLVLAHCERYMAIIDKEWAEIASWYTKPPARPHVTTLRVSDLFREFPHRMKDKEPEPTIEADGGGDPI